jgi:hypothetical protein
MARRNPLPRYAGWRVEEASNPGPKDWDIQRPIYEVLTLSGTVTFDLEPYDDGTSPSTWSPTTRDTLHLSV